MRAALTDKNEAQGFQHATDLARLENWGLRHGLGRDRNILGAYKLSVQLRFSVLEQHFDDFTEVSLKFLQRFALGMRAGESRNVTDVKAGIGTTLNDRREFFHKASVR